MFNLTRQQLLSRLEAEYDKMYYSPYAFYTTYRNRTYFCRSCDRQMFLDVRHPESVSLERLQEIHEYIIDHNAIK